jgi:hypothetical protein
LSLFDELTEENFILFASKHYNNPQCTSLEEFYEDLFRFKHLKKLLKRYLINDDLRERLILNHLIVIYNIFGIKAANRMIFFKFEKRYWPALKTFLIFLNYLEESELVDVQLDTKIIGVLRDL